ncbi:conserved hypothetical protein [Hyella patelloides LEGE 07179]|uniref:Class I SAM-dependent methyltransferase n=2 Tax=Hyella TaxID=945733 RepID=A0A563VR11_9CYAN|nr:conserved hypothetical protein [Hyella patelloides LEGE 07179]
MQKKTIKCRLCSGAATYVFSKKLIQKYEVAFFHCNQCESLQTEAPYWLDEAYEGCKSIPDIATVSRCQNLKSIVYMVAKIFGLSSSDMILDWGGGDGLLTRMMRDAGLNAYLLDKYIRNHYAVGFEDRLTHNYKMITAFEVLEHFSNPETEIENIFKRNPEILFISTGLYKSQDSDWGYLTPLSGRHVFFYSEKSRQHIAKRFGYELITEQNFSIFYKNTLDFSRRWLLKLVLSGKNPNLLRILFYFVPKESLIMQDREMATKKIKNGEPGKINWP